MIIFTTLLAVAAIMADAYTTRVCLKSGRKELWPLRYLLIRLLGINGGTYGVAFVMVAAVFAVNVLSRQPSWGLILGNLIIAAMLGFSSVRNWGLR